MPAADVRPPPQGITQETDGFVKAVAQAGARLVMLIDCSKVIGEEQIHGG
jgi:chemotaxis signal transduction protein